MHGKKRNTAEQEKAGTNKTMNSEIESKIVKGCRLLSFCVNKKITRNKETQKTKNRVIHGNDGAISQRCHSNSQSLNMLCFVKWQ